MLIQRVLPFTLLFCLLNCLDVLSDGNQIKVRNELSETLTMVKIGNVEYQNIAAGSVSEAQSLDAGVYTLTAITESNVQYSQQVSFLGRFLSFTVIFRSGGSVEVQRE